MGDHLDPFRGQVEDARQGIALVEDALGRFVHDQARLTAMPFGQGDMGLERHMALGCDGVGGVMDHRRRGEGDIGIATRIVVDRLALGIA